MNTALQPIDADAGDTIADAMTAATMVPLTTARGVDDADKKLLASTPPLTELQDRNQRVLLPSMLRC